MAKFAVTITFADFAARDAARPEHRVYLKSLFDQGKLVESGPFVDDTGALLIYEAESQAQVEAWFDEDPYARAGNVVAERTIKEWNRVFPPL